MKKEELIFSLSISKKTSYTENVGYKWKNPLNPRSKGKRWTNEDLSLFRKFQIEYK